MLWMEGRNKDERMFLRNVTKMMLMLIGLLAFGGAPVLVSQVLYTHQFLYVFIYVLYAMVSNIQKYCMDDGVLDVVVSRAIAVYQCQQYQQQQ